MGFNPGDLVDVHYTLEENGQPRFIDRRCIYLHTTDGIRHFYNTDLAILLKYVHPVGMSKGYLEILDTVGCVLISVVPMQFKAVKVCTRDC